jgi:hypothetical protein
VRLGVPVYHGHSKDVFDASMAVTSDASGLDRIPLSFVKMILPVVLPDMTYLFNFIFTCCELTFI